MSQKYERLALDIMHVCVGYCFMSSLELQLRNEIFYDITVKTIFIPTNMLQDDHVRVGLMTSVHKYQTTYKQIERLISCSMYLTVNRFNQVL